MTTGGARTGGKDQALTRYVAFLRGINVGRNKRIAMADLRTLLSDLGHTDVATYLQSGNAVFTSSSRSPAKIGRDLEAGIEREFGMSVSCLVRSVDQLRAVVAANPLADVATDGSKYLVTFLSGTPDLEIVGAIDPAEYEPEAFRIIGQEVYLWCPKGILDSALPKVFSDKQLKLVTTARNWNTVTKLLALAEN